MDIAATYGAMFAILMVDLVGRSVEHPHLRPVVVVQNGEGWDPVRGR